MYLSYITCRHRVQPPEWNFVTLLLVLVGWISLLYRIHAEERVLSQHPEWPAYVVLVATAFSPVFGESAVCVALASSSTGRSEAREFSHHCIKDIDVGQADRKIRCYRKSELETRAFTALKYLLLIGLCLGRCR